MNQQKLALATAQVQDYASLKFSLHLYETLPSTNQTLWSLIDQGAEPGTVVIATQQTAGRGQWGRQWVSPEGGLYLSVALAPHLPAHHSYLLTLCSVWGIAWRLRDCGIPVGIKWPNDLILNGYKLGGILTETRVQQGVITKAVVGVGINWTNPVPEAGINLYSFINQGENGEEGTQESPVPSSPFPVPLRHHLDSLETLAALTLLGIASGNQYSTPEEIDNLLPSYQMLLTSRGRLVSVDGRSGVIIGINKNGDLRVRFCPETGIITSNLSQGIDSSTEICLKPGKISLGYC